MKENKIVKWRGNAEESSSQSSAVIHGRDVTLLAQELGASSSIKAQFTFTFVLNDAEYLLTELHL